MKTEFFNTKQTNLLKEKKCLKRAMRDRNSSKFALEKERKREKTHTHKQ